MGQDPNFGQSYRWGLRTVPKGCASTSYRSTAAEFAAMFEALKGSGPRKESEGRHAGAPRDMEAVIKAAASVASLGFAGERQDDGSACGRRGTGRSPANPREAALADNLITASSIRRLLVVPR